VAISACIIARNEQESLPDALASVAFCQEIVLIDSGSTDATMEIARAAGARVIEHSWRGYAAQRNVALDHARGEWILEIDADERVSPRLREEIEAFLANPPGVDLAGLPLREMFLGHPLGPSGKYPKYRHRLLRRGAYRHDERRTVHEGIVPDGPVHPFSGDLIHLLATSWTEAVGDSWRYARLEAGQLTGARTPARILQGALLRPAAKLLYRLAVDGGWRDGWAGAAKIGLDCATDSLVWIRYLLGARGSELGTPEWVRASTTAHGRSGRGRSTWLPWPAPAPSARGRPPGLPGRHWRVPTWRCWLRAPPTPPPRPPSRGCVCAGWSVSGRWS